MLIFMCEKTGILFLVSASERGEEYFWSIGALDSSEAHILSLLYGTINEIEEHAVFIGFL